MSRLLFPLGVLAVVAFTGCSDQVIAPNADSTPRGAAFASRKASSAGPTGQHIVSFSGRAPADFAQRVAALGGKVQWVKGAAGLATVKGLSATAAATLAKEAGIASVDSDLSFSIDEPMAKKPPRRIAGTAQSSDDPSTAFFFGLGLQWNMLAVHADDAWANGKLGSGDVSVFLLDTGIDYLHLDLLGLVDLARSTDLTGTFDVNGVPFTEADTVAKYFPTRAPFTDLFFHGTHVGSTVSSNAIVAAGVTSKTKLVAVKVCAYINACPLSSVLNGVIYAADNGADVVNMSLGGGFAKAGNGGLVGLINKTFNYARSKGVTIVVGAGNAAADLDHIGNVFATYCDVPGVICVSATGPTSQGSDFGPFTDVDHFASYSNFGRSAISVAAPGGDNDSFVWAACSQTSLLVPACGASPTFVIGVQGTSMSTPHVSGTAALLVAELGRKPSEIKHRIQKGADDLGQPGTDPFYGKGRLNVAGALGF